MKSLKISGVLMYLFGLVVLLLLYFYLVFTPMTVQVAKLDAAHQQNTAQIQMYEQQNQQKDKLESKISELQSELDTLNQNANVNGNTVAEDIGKACEFAGIKPISIQVGDETVNKSKTSSSGQPLCSVPVNLEATCSETQVQNLLDYFENQSHGAYYVNTVNYAFGQKPSSAQFTLTLYYFGTGEAKK